MTQQQARHIRRILGNAPIAAFQGVPIDELRDICRMLDATAAGGEAEPASDGKLRLLIHIGALERTIVDAVPLLEKHRDEGNIGTAEHQMCKGVIEAFGFLLASTCERLPK